MLYGPGVTYCGAPQTSLAELKKEQGCCLDDQQSCLRSNRSSNITSHTQVLRTRWTPPVLDMESSVAIPAAGHQNDHCSRQFLIDACCGGLGFDTFSVAGDGSASVVSVRSFMKRSPRAPA